MARQVDNSKGALAARTVLSLEDGVVYEREDAVLVEVPLEIRWAGDALATTMRTPGQDHDLAIGFLRSEGIIRGAGDLGTVAHCGRPAEEGYGNVIDVSPGPGAAIDPDQRVRRGTLVSAACGVCGRQSIADLLERESPVQGDVSMPIGIIFDALRNLPETQPVHARTGTTHGAALHAHDGRWLATQEDIGRHNAVDKLVGQRVRGALPGTPSLLVVSGRLSFEMVHKAAVLGVPVVASSSAPSTLALDLAAQMRICVVGFARHDRANIYTWAERIKWARQ